MSLSSTVRFRSFSNAATFFVIVLTLSLLATGGSYALWNSATTVNGGTLSTGSTTLTVNGAASSTIPSLAVTKLFPGASVTATATLANTGTTALDARIGSVAVSSNTNGLAASLTLRVTPVASSAACVAGLTGQTAALSSFATTGSPWTIAAGGSMIVCIELKLDSSAPSTVQNGATAFTINFVADQKRPV